MKRRSIFFALAVSLFIGCVEKEKTGKENFSEFLKAYSDKLSIEYDVDYRIKFFDYDDTTKLKAHCILIKSEKDSLFGGYIWYSRKDSLNNFTKYYDLSDLYYIDHNKKEVTRFDLEKNPPSSITGMVDGEVININFLNPQKLKKAATDSSNVISYSKENDIEKIQIRVKDDPPVINQSLELIIDSSNNHILRKTYQAELDNLIQYNQWDLYNIQFNTSTAKDLENRFQALTKQYIFKDFKPRTEEETAPLKNGSKVPKFKGEYFPQRKELFKSTDLKDKIVLFDFWYRSCQPCVQTIPQLNRLHQKYKDQNIKIIGLNPFDNDSVSKTKLLDFIKYHKMDYPIVFVDSTTVKKFNVWSYPTLFMTDKNGKIVYSKTGYDENTEKEIDSILKVIQ
ncbi:TlpA family protein disulfide reductase [Aequorivita sp. H23M31]|uniref:TlpA family protein disulfide reductase n=1 Tax=Aequorivita ciconiae TaxID=2494375 RepID=A0A410G5M2_9FLAO|nr:TlpA disulfide reductase family protein [Aequorivita sp. H23M31]QAA82540.1 TlpA family protein disulfide reductase [Aequorivita sp. H23M31]